MAPRGAGERRLPVWDGAASSCGSTHEGLEAVTDSTPASVPSDNLSDLPVTAAPVKLADVPAGSVVMVRARVRRYKDHEHSFTDLMVEHVNGYRDPGPGTARLFQHRNVEVEVVE
jgi:hypothetical protein